MARGRSAPHHHKPLRRGRRLLALIGAVATVASIVAIPGAPGAGAASAYSPVGVAEPFIQTPGGLRVMGWTYDPSVITRPITVSITIDGSVVSNVTADRPRPDVAKANPKAGANHGFYRAQPVPEGKHTVCVIARNIYHGIDRTLLCTTRTMDYGPRGALNLVTPVPGKLRITGWAADPDVPAAVVSVQIRIDTQSPVTVSASRNRPDIAPLLHSDRYGTKHGFDVTLATAQGTHTVCLTAISLGYGKNNSLGCKTVTLNDNPRARIDVLAQERGKVHLRGWAFDGDQPTQALRISVRVDKGAAKTYTAAGLRRDVERVYPGVGPNHGYDELLSLTEGTHSVCVTVENVGFGSNAVFRCRSVAVNFRPTATLTALSATAAGVTFRGWATDPDTVGPLKVRITIDGATKATITANLSGSTYSGNNFAASLFTVSGTRRICAIAVNLGAGRSDSVASCRSISLKFAPVGRFDTLARSGSSDNLLITGWAVDPDTSRSASVGITVDGTFVGTYRASANRTDVGRKYTQAGDAHGVSVVIVTDDGEHTVCLTAHKVSGTATTSLGCRTINAVNPAAPSAPSKVSATSDYGQSVVTWRAPTSDGGAPWTKYTIVASPGGRTVTAAANATSATVTGLATTTTYTFGVTATNVAGTSPAGVSPKVTTKNGPAPQQTPAPISTSRYIRNIRGSSAAEQSLMRAEGVADAKSNPSGHRYLMLLDIGGQDQYYGGVVLSATTRFVTYGDLVKDVKAYIDGYASAQRSTAPAMITIGTNNDLDVSAAAGAAWADKVVDPLVSYTRKYSGLTISGANDIEPGFRGSYSATKNWLAGYLGATSAQFVFNGSADGCAYTVTNRGCNNGYTMSGLYNLAAGAAPTRMINLPQVYNYTMADQWKYISLTGVGQGQPRINFGGPLTEYTACAQAGSCGSITGNRAWSRMWSNLQSHPALKVSSLPYSTDLRIDR